MLTDMATLASDYLALLHIRNELNQAELTNNLLTADIQSLSWRVRDNSWSALQHIAHLNLTHTFFQIKIDRALLHPPYLGGNDSEVYRPSFWRRMLRRFALTPMAGLWGIPELTPNTYPRRQVLNAYLDKNKDFSDLLTLAARLDLGKTLIPIAARVSINFGDCLWIIAQHDRYHLNEASQIWTLAQLSSDSIIERLPDLSEVGHIVETDRHIRR